MKCSTLPVWLVNLNGHEAHLCGKCMNQLAINRENVSVPINDEPIKNVQCECKGCGKH